MKSGPFISIWPDSEREGNKSTSSLSIGHGGDVLHIYQNTLI